MSNYLSIEQAKQRLLTAKDYTEETLPSDEELAFVLEVIEVTVDNWLGYSPGTPERVEPWRDCSPLKYPVQEELETFEHVADAREALRDRYESPLHARYDPLPPIFGMVIFQVLRKALQTSGTSGDLSFLDEPVRDVTSIGLPGGLSKSWQLGSASGDKNASGETQLDRLLKPLSTYRHKYVF